MSSRNSESSAGSVVAFIVALSDDDQAAKVKTF
jgi:hypothetical protein